jgi:hypothetical protein
MEVVPVPYIRIRKHFLAAVAASLVTVAAAPAAASAGASDSVYCDEPVSQVFSAFGDENYYALAPSGDFEGTLADWSLSGGAEQVADAHSDISGDTGAYALQLPNGASATSPAACVDPSRDAFRFFVRSAKAKARVKVEALFTKAGSGKATVANVAYVSSAAGAWEPTPILRNGAAKFLPGDSTGTVSYRFTADSGTVAIDDLYIDPHLRR